MTTLSNLDAIEVIPVQNDATTTVTGDAVDLQGLLTGRQLKGILSVLSNGADADETLDITMEESDTTVASDFGAISGFAINHTQPVANAVLEDHFRTDKQYVRAVATIGGTTPDFTFGVAILAEMRYTP